MAHINPVFVIATSELAISNGQEKPEGKLLKGPRPPDPEGSTTPTSKCAQFKNMIRSKWKWSWVFNASIVIFLGLVIVVLEFDIFPFRPLGYHCEDPDLSHKYRGDTVRFSHLIAVSVFSPLISILVVEFLVNSNPLVRNSWKKRNWLQALCWYAQFFLGLLLLLFFIQLGKSLVGEPRPHFFDTCKPDQLNCTGYVARYKCTNKDLPARDIRDSFRSFPSGHAALGFYLAIFISWYFQSRVQPGDYLIVPFLQCLSLAWALLCSLTRITDHRHHWWDVLVGSILGVAVAIFTVKMFCKNFRSLTAKVRTKDKNLNEPEGSINSWYKKTYKSSSIQQPDEKELREIK